MRNQLAVVAMMTVTAAGWPAASQAQPPAGDKPAAAPAAAKPAAWRSPSRHPRTT